MVLNLKSYRGLILLASLVSNSSAAPWELDANYMSSPQGVNERVYALGLDSAKRLIVGGLFTTAEGTNSRGLTRFFKDGKHDSSFLVGGGVANGTYNYVTDLLVLSDDSVVVVGDFGSFNSVARGNIAKIRPNGSVDEHFASGLGANAIIRHIEHSGDGGYIIGGNFNSYNGVVRSRIAKLKADGSLDESITFDHTFDSDEWVDQIEVFPNGDVLAAGDFEPYNVKKFLADGSSDPSFLYHYYNYDYVEATCITTDGKILIGGVGGLHRHHADGSFDDSFQALLNNGPEVYGLSELSEGQIIATGRFGISGTPDIYNMAIFHDDGSVDTSTVDEPFESSGWIGPTVLQDDYLIFAGAFTALVNKWNTQASSYNRIARFNTTPPNNPPNAVYFDRNSITLIEDSDYIPSFNLKIDETPDAPITVLLEVAEKAPDDLGHAFPQIPNPITIPAEGPNNTEISVRSSTEDWGYQGPRRIVHRIKSVKGDAVIGEPNEIEVILIDKDPPPAVRFAQSYMELVEDGWHQFEPTSFKVIFDNEVEPFVNIQIIPEAETTEIEDSIFIFPDYINSSSGLGYDEIDIAADDDSVVRGPDMITLRLVADEGYEHLIGTPSTMEIRRHDSTSLDGWLILRYPENWNDDDIYTIDSDKDGQPTLLEWLNNSDPLNASDLKIPAGFTEYVENDERYFSVRFYYAGLKPGYACILEQKNALTDIDWATIWRNDDDPILESELILEHPSSEENDWIEIRLPEAMGTNGFVRVRYEPIPD